MKRERVDGLRARPLARLPVLAAYSFFSEDVTRQRPCRGKGGCRGDEERHAG